MKIVTLPTALAVLLVVEHTSGFAPPQLPPTATVRTRGVHSPPPEASSMALHATSNIFDRFFRVARGNINNVLQKFEDPEKVMDQALIDMQNDIVKVRQTYAELSATQRRLVSRKSRFDATADDWYRRAQLALKRGNNEALAREALARREQALQEASELQKQINVQDESLEKLFTGMKALEQKILQAKSQKDQLAARARTAKSTQSVNDMLSGLTGKTSMDAFRRMEDKVVALEAAAEVSIEMANNDLLLSSSSLTDDTKSKKDIELEFQLLEASDQVEKELQQLKDGMQLGLPPPKASAIPSSKSVQKVRDIPISKSKDTMLIP